MWSTSIRGLPSSRPPDRRRSTYKSPDCVQTSGATSSIGFHPLHTAPAILVYGVVTLPKRTRLLGTGLLIHIGLDALDCMLM